MLTEELLITITELWKTKFLYLRVMSNNLDNEFQKASKVGYIYIGITLLITIFAVVFFILWLNCDCELSDPDEVDNEITKTRNKIELYDEKIESDSISIHNSDIDELERKRAERFHKYMHGDSLHD